jgi:sugar transferase (PEP-CTERM system associated)
MGQETGTVQPVHDRSEIGSLRDFALANQVDEIVTAMEERRGNLPVRDLLDCRLAGIQITDYAAFMERETGKVDLDGFVPSWLIFSQGSTEAQIRLLIKRVMDLAASAVLVTITAPVVLVTAILIRLTSPGPVLYRQERVGQHGRLFMLYKFRSMRTDAEADGPKWAMENDPRVTPVGRVIRKLRIDELPQIFNVLKGDMSFVGPRPERLVFVEDLARQLPYYAERHTVRPGITGWAQVNYPYGASFEDAKQKAQYDLYYIKNFSVFLDILILIKTIRVILFGSGAR